MSGFLSNGRLLRRALLNSVAREPLLHFLCLGLALFFIYEMKTGSVTDDDSMTIHVGRSRIVAYMQQRSRLVDREYFNGLLNEMTESQRRAVIDAYVREEALYREAKALQLDENDYVARRRLIQTFEFITRGLAGGRLPDVTEADIESYYAAHRDSFYVEPTATFTHVFFSSEKHSEEGARALARSELEKLNGGGVSFHEASKHGDRFLYQLNYVESPPDEIGSHFGRAMLLELMSLPPDEHTWRGPFQSQYGFHLVMLTRRTEGHIQPLADVYAEVEEEARRARREREFEAQIEKIVGRYHVDVVPLCLPGSDAQAQCKEASRQSEKGQP